MPKWCYTELMVNGPEDAIARLKAECFTDGVLDFDRVVPLPNAYGIRPGSHDAAGPAAMHGGHPSCVEWCLEHWGPRSNIDKQHFDLEVDQPGGLRMYFDTAWNPALPVLTALAQRFPDLLFHMRYADEDGSFAGEAFGESGQRRDEPRAWRTMMTTYFALDGPDEECALESTGEADDVSLRVRV